MVVCTAAAFAQKAEISAAEKFEAIKTHVEILRRYYDENWLTLYLRKHFLWYTNSFQNGNIYNYAAS